MPKWSRRPGLTVPELFARDGEVAFRDAEARGAPAGLRKRSAGRGLRGGRRRAASRKTVPCCAPAAGWSGCGPGSRRWPSGSVTAWGDRFSTAIRQRRCGELDAVRRPLYAEVADDVIDVDELSPDEVATRIVDRSTTDASEEAPVDA